MSGHDEGPRWPQVQRVSAVLARGAGHGVIVAGDPGSGRAQVLRSALREAGRGRPEVVLFVAEEGPGEPFAALAPWLGAASSTAWCLGEVVMRLGEAWAAAEGESGGRPPLVMVDELAELDLESARALSLLLSAERVGLVAMTAERIPEAAATRLLLRDPRTEWLRLLPLGEAESRQWCEVRVGGRLSDAAAAWIAEWGRGNAQLLRAVVEQALEQGALVAHGGRWVVDAEWSPRGGLVDEALADLGRRGLVAPAQGTAPRGSAIPRAANGTPGTAAGGLAEAMAGWWERLEGEGADGALAAIRAVREGDPRGLARHEHGSLCTLEALALLAAGRQAASRERSLEAVAELGQHDPLDLAPAATVLAGHSVGAEGPWDSGSARAGDHGTGEEAVLGRSAVALAEAMSLREQLGNSAALVGAARAAARLHPVAARLILLELRNAAAEPRTLVRLRAVAEALPGGWPHQVTAGLLALDVGTPVEEVEAAVRSAHGLGLVRVAVRSLEWSLLHGATRPTGEQLRLRRLLGSWVQELGAGAGAAPLGLGESVALTEREREIVLRTRDGHSNRQIARALFLSQRTVEGHLYRAFQKLGVSHRGQLAELSL